MHSIAQNNWLWPVYVMALKYLWWNLKIIKNLEKALKHRIPNTDNQYR